MIAIDVISQGINHAFIATSVAKLRIARRVYVYSLSATNARVLSKLHARCLGSSGTNDGRAKDARLGEKRRETNSVNLS